MEKDNNIFPEIKIFNPIERFRRIGNYITGLFNNETSNTGASPLLDEMLFTEDISGSYYQPELFDVRD